jgi:hypothetical protein
LDTAQKEKCNVAIQKDCMGARWGARAFCGTGQAVSSGNPKLDSLTAIGERLAKFELSKSRKELAAQFKTLKKQGYIGVMV